VQNKKTSILLACMHTAMCVLGLSVVIAAWRFVGAAGDCQVQLAMSYASGPSPDLFADPFAGLLDVVGGFLWTVWMWIRLCMIVAIGMGVTTIVIGLLFITGALAWMCRSLAVGVAYAISLIRGQRPAAADPGVNALPASIRDSVVGTDDDGDVTLADVLEDYDQQLEELSERVLDAYDQQLALLSQRIERLEQGIANVPV
jgi:hypothetical protein